VNGGDMLGGEIATGGTPSNMGDSGPFPQIGYPFETDKVVLQLLQMLKPLGVNHHLFFFGKVGGLDDRMFHFLCLSSLADRISVRNPRAEGDDTIISAIP
jgi:hypothetical protein